MFQVNDTVLYSTHGVCRIAEMAEKDFGGEKMMTYYVLKPVYDESSTLFVPADNENLTKKMQRILSADEIHALIRSMPDEEALWIENEPLRREKYKEIISGGDRVELLQLIKAVYQHRLDQKEKGKKVHIADERFLKEAEKLLYDEFAHVLNIEPEEVVDFIVEQIRLVEHASTQEPEQ